MYKDTLYSNFTDDLDKHAGKIIDILDKFNLGIYLYKNDYDNKKDSIAFRIPGRTIGSISINYDTGEILKVGFCIGAKENTKLTDDDINKWVGKKIEIRYER